MQKFEITVIETVLVQRKTKYTILAENEQEFLDAKGKSTDFLSIVDTEIETDRDCDSPTIKEIIKSKIITE